MYSVNRFINQQSPDNQFKYCQKHSTITLLMLANAKSSAPNCWNPQATPLLEISVTQQSDILGRAPSLHRHVNLLILCGTYHTPQLLNGVCCLTHSITYSVTHLCLTGAMCHAPKGKVPHGPIAIIQCRQNYFLQVNMFCVCFTLVSELHQRFLLLETRSKHFPTVFHSQTVLRYLRPTCRFIYMLHHLEQI